MSRREAARLHSAIFMERGSYRQRAISRIAEGTNRFVEEREVNRAVQQYHHSQREGFGDIRYYLSSLPVSVKKFSSAVRAH